LVKVKKGTKKQSLSQLLSAFNVFGSIGFLSSAEGDGSPRCVIEKGQA
jgi:hypothetical protein